MTGRPKLVVFDMDGTLINGRLIEVISRKQIRDGKAEGMIIGILMAKMHNKKYVGFIDSDNYFPGAVNEYCKIYAVGFGMASTPYSNIRISWLYKPKIRNNILKFPKYRRHLRRHFEYLV